MKAFAARRLALRRLDCLRFGLAMEVVSYWSTCLLINTCEKGIKGAE